MDTSSITTYGASAAYDPALLASTSGSGSSQDFAALLDSQMSGTSDSSGSSGSDAALGAYSAGQMMAYSLSQSDTDTTASESDGSQASQEVAASGDTSATGDAAATTEDASATGATGAASTAGDAASSSGETSETSQSDETASTGNKGYPSEVWQEWTPVGMQFYDETTGQWVDDDIPHRLNADGDLEYQWQGEWYKDTAVRHRMVFANGETQEVDESGEATAGGDATASAEGTETSDAETTDSGTSPEEYFNETLQSWKLFNFPSRTNPDGTREYYWADAWHEDDWQHRSA